MDDAEYGPVERVQSWLDSEDGLAEDGLGLVIRGVMVPIARPPHERFLPFDRLAEIMTVENIVKELQRTERLLGESVTTQEHEATARQILEWQDSCEPLTNRRCLFAILCLMNMAIRIVDFIREGLFDGDMPFVSDDSGTYRRNDTSTAPISFFKRWKRTQRDMFEHYQGSFLVPFFNLSKGISSKIAQIELSSSAILPFLEDEAASQVIQVGGYSTVRKVRIHEAHHDLEDRPVSTSCDLHHSQADPY